MTEDFLFCWRCTLVLAMFAGLCASVQADQITYQGKVYRDVLIYQSPSMYYVKVPDEGRVFNVPKSSVPASEVRIERDPYYRDELKRVFEENEKAPSRSSASSSSGFSADGSGGAASGEAAAGIIDAARAALGSMGFTVEDTDDGFKATDPTGTTTITMAGAAMSLVSTLPEVQAPMMQAQVGQMGPLLGGIAPWIPAWLTEDVVPLFTAGGSTEKSEGGVSAGASVEKAGGNVTFTLNIQPAG